MEDLYYRNWDEGIDEASLPWTDRLGLAYCRLNGWEWDDLLGPKPKGFDDLPNYDRKRGMPFHKSLPSKQDYIDPAINAIRSIIGEANASRCHWKFSLGRTEEEWFKWYVSERFRKRTLE